jgi:hypothetical protein
VKDRQLWVVVQAPAAEFVETNRLEEVAGGAVWCTWRSILTGYYLYVAHHSPPTRPTPHTNTIAMDHCDLASSALN